MTELINQRTAEVDAAKEHGAQDALSDDMLTRMIEASAVEEQKLSKQELIDITMQVIAAGHETTASALLWTIYALSKAPAVQSCLRNEILALEPSMISAKAIDELPYLDNVIREALRVYSPTLIVPWESLDNMNIAGVQIPKGTTVQIVPAKSGVPMRTSSNPSGGMARPRARTRWRHSQMVRGCALERRWLC
ncbi:hypothetical protein ACHAP5_007376 [Fusarium lateritium]